MKAYIKGFILRYLPLFIITGVIAFTSLLTIVLDNFGSYSIYCNRDIGNNACYPLSNTSSIYILLAFSPLYIVTTISPLFVNTYRYHIKSVDTYYQVKDGEKKIRYINNLVTIIMLIGIYTAVFLTFLLLLFIKQSSMSGKEVINGYTTTYYYMYNYGYYFLAYLITAILCTINYFISYYFVTRSNNLVNSMITLVAGHISLAMVFVTLIYYPYIYALRYGASGYLSPWVIGVHSASPISLFIAEFYIFLPLIDPHYGGYETLADFSGAYQITMIFISLSCFIAVSVYSIIKFFKEDTLSGEYAGKPYGRSKMQNIIFHIAFGSVGVWIGGMISLIRAFSSAASFITTLMVLTSFLATYYVLFSLLNRNFKITKQSFLEMLPVLSIVFTSILVAIMMLVTPVAYPISY